MKTIMLFIALVSLVLAVPAQPLPKIQLKPVFPKLTNERPLWITEAPDGSGRLFVVYQAGETLAAK